MKSISEMSAIEKVIFYLGGITLAVVLFCTAKTLHLKLVSCGAVILIIYMGLSKRIIPKDVTEIFISEKNEVIDIPTEEKEKLIVMLSKERGHFIPNRDYTYDEKVVVIKSNDKRMELYFGTDVAGQEVIKINKGFFEVELEEKDRELYKQLLGIKQNRESHDENDDL